MLLKVLLIPFFLELDRHVPDNIEEPEFIYHMNKTTQVWRDPLQTIITTARIDCHAIPSDTLYCILKGLNFTSKLYYKNIDTEHHITEEAYFPEEWFQIKFTNTGVKQIFANNTSIRKGIIKDFGYQLNIGADLSRSRSISPTLRNLNEQEKTIVGECTTSYDIHTTSIYLRHITSENETTVKKYFQIIVLGIETNFSTTCIPYVNIEKLRTNCQHTPAFTEFLNGLEKTKYDHTIEIFGDKFNSETIMDVRLPIDPWHPTGTPLFRETTQLNLTKIEKSTSNSVKFTRTQAWEDLF